MDKTELQNLINTYGEKIKELSAMQLGYIFVPERYRVYISALAQHQEDVIQVMTVLPGKYRFEQVEAAIRTSGVSPRTIYEDLAANKYTASLVLFHQTLKGIEMSAIPKPDLTNAHPFIPLIQAFLEQVLHIKDDIMALDITETYESMMGGKWYFTDWKDWNVTVTLPDGSIFPKIYLSVEYQAGEYVVSKLAFQPGWKPEKKEV